MGERRARYYLIPFILLVLYVSGLCGDATLSSMRSELRRAVNETSADRSYYSDSELDGYINQGLEWACKKAVGYVKETTFVTVRFQESYVLPEDFIEYLNAYVKSGLGDTTYQVRYTKWSWLGMRYTGSELDRSEPYEFTIYLDTLLAMKPIPRRSNDTVVLKYSAEPADLSDDGDTCFQDVDIRDLAIEYALNKCLRKDREYDIYFSYRQELERRAEMIRRKNEGATVPTNIPEIEK